VKREMPMCLGHDSQFRSPSLTPGTFLDHLYRAISLQTLSQFLFLLSGNSLPPSCWLCTSYPNTSIPSELRTINIIQDCCAPGFCAPTSNVKVPPDSSREDGQPPPYERRPDAVIMEQGYPQQDCGEREGRANDQLPRLGLPTSKEEREKFKLAPPDGVQLFRATKRWPSLR
jgi:hypothetical protein